MPEPNPNQALPAPAPESLPKPPKTTSENLGRVSPEAPPAEQAPAPASPEVARPAGEAGSQNAGAPTTAIDLPTPISPTAPAPKTQAPSDQPTTDSPAIADDVDVIEKEWVDKAKSIVDQHRDDPYKQEEEANKLQSSYLKKRYGKTIKKST